MFTTVFYLLIIFNITVVIADCPKKLQNGAEITQNGGESYTKITDVYYACFILKPEINMVFIEANLTEGQWIKGPGRLDPALSPIGQQLVADGDTTICSAGCDKERPGTEGHVIFQHSEGSPIKLSWMNTAATYKYSINALKPNEFHIEEKPVADYLTKFIITNAAAVNI